MKSIRLRAFAKANMSLNITGRDEKTGMHELDSVMVSVDLYDIVTVTERADSEIVVRFLNADIGENNTARKAALALQKRVDGRGFDIEIEKRIPIGAGLGGSSADAAAVIRALDVMYDLGKKRVDLRSVALSVGSDVPFMLTGGLARVCGTGDDMFFIANKLPPFIIGLMNGPVSTAEAYKTFDEIYPEGKYCPTDNDALCNSLLAAKRDYLDHLGNALFEPARRLCPGIDECAEKLKSIGAAVNMTGSGGMVLGYFDDLQAFSDALRRIKGSKEYRVFTSSCTGILHDWLSRE